MEFANIHERWMPGDMARAAQLLDGLAGPGDRLWPRQSWPEMRFQGRLEVGAAGGHGPIRYRVEGYEPGRQVSFQFLPETGFEGHHWFELVPRDGGVLLRHGLKARGGLLGSVYWTLAIRFLHDALVEDALDNAERALTGDVKRPARWSLWVRALRAGMRLLNRRPVPAPAA